MIIEANQKLGCFGQHLLGAGRTLLTLTAPGRVSVLDIRDLVL
jgi:hypothetical protein